MQGGLAAPLDSRTTYCTEEISHQLETNVNHLCASTGYMHTKHAVVLWQLSLRACTAHLLVRTAGYLHETAPNVLGPGKMLFGGPLAGNSLQRQPPSRPGRQHHDNSIGGDHDDGNGDRDDAVDALLKRPVIAQITPDGSSCSSASAELIRSVSRAVAGGVSLVQLRDYQGNTESKADLARRICQVTAGSSAWFVVNLNDGDCSWVRDCGADGVHLPEREIGLLAGLRHSNAQSAWPTVVGCSVHSVGAALAAAKLGADYVQVSEHLVL